MSANTSIEWCHHTFNPWWGCAKVSEGCKNCYAEAFAKRTGNDVWGEGRERRLFGDKHWDEPLKWNRDAMAAGGRRRVFCASMADVFEDHRDLDDQRERLWPLVDATPGLDWLLLTKRPENFARFMPHQGWPGNVWLGVTAESNDMARWRIPMLAEQDAAVRFVSAEPLLEEPDWVPTDMDWVIWGGESGPRSRACELSWLEAGVRACIDVGAQPFVKQLGSRLARAMRLRDAKGGDWSEWPNHLRVREFPGGTLPGEERRKP